MLLSLSFQIFTLLLSIRANVLGQMAVKSQPLKEEHLKFSPFLLCSKTGLTMAGMAAGSPPPSQVTSGTTSPPLSPFSAPVSAITAQISLQDMFQAIIACLRKDKDWNVLQLVLKYLPPMLLNKSLLVSGHQSLIGDLCNAFCSFVSFQYLPICFATC